MLPRVEVGVRVGVTHALLVRRKEPGASPKLSVLTIEIGMKGKDGQVARVGDQPRGARKLKVLS